MSFIAAIFLLGILIFLHELGHFTMAKLFNVKVEAFSIGFGPKLFGIQLGETEYKISLVPLGGYVKLLGEEPDDFGLPLPPDEQARTLNAQPFWKKALILVAGPGTNLILPFFIYFLVAVSSNGQPVTAPEIGVVYGDPAIRAGLMPGDKVLAIDGTPIDEWEDMLEIISSAAGKQLELTIERNGKQLKLKIVPEPVETFNVFKERVTTGRIGISPEYSPPILGVPEIALPAIRAGLKTGDKVVSVNGEKIKRWIDLVDRLSANKGNEVKLEILRPKVLGEYDSDIKQMQLTYKVPHTNALGGMLPPDTYVGQVDTDTEIGKVVKPGDRILSINGKPIRHFYAIYTMLPQLKDKDFNLVFEHAGNRQSIITRLTKQERKGPYKDLGPIYKLGIHWIGESADNVVPKTIVHRPFGELVAFSVEQSKKVMDLGIKSMVMLVTGKLSLKQLGGPIMIVDVARRAYSTGIAAYMHTMALISVSLGILNLLPIPLLDGGQFVFYAIEAIRRKPLPLAVQEKINFIGLFILLSLMALVFINDISRYWSSFVGMFKG